MDFADKLDLMDDDRPMKYMAYDNIDMLLDQRGMSRRELARRAGISASNMSALFARRSVPMKAKYLDRIAETLGVDKAEIETYKPNRGNKIRVVLTAFVQTSDTDYTHMFRTVEIDAPDDGNDWHVCGEEWKDER